MISEKSNFTFYYHIKLLPKTSSLTAKAKEDLLAKTKMLKKAIPLGVLFESDTREVFATA